MSKHIDMSNPSAWTPDEVAYLRERGRLPVDFVEVASGASTSDDAEPEDYEEGWNNEERRAELSRRGLSVDGKKDELIARLLASDAGTLDDDEDDSDSDSDDDDSDEDEDDDDSDDDEDKD